MDGLAGLLDGPRARDAFLLRLIMVAPWSIRIQDRSPLALSCVVRGEAWISRDGGESVRLGAGDVAVFRGPEPYTMADSPGRPPRTIVHPGQHCATPDGAPLATAMALGPRTWGDAVDGSTVLLTGVYERPGEISRPLLRALPPLLVLRAEDWDCPLVPLLADEIVRESPGQEAVLDRLLDLLLIAVLRAWFDRPEGAAPAWYAALADPVVGPALRLVHDSPERDWTVASLAGAVGASRAAFARRFTALVGEPPRAYLTSWRLATAADLLRDPTTTLDAVARAVGYGSAFALSTAFLRVRGVRPRDHRAALAR